MVATLLQLRLTAKRVRVQLRVPEVESELGSAAQELAQIGFALPTDSCSQRVSGKGVALIARVAGDYLAVRIKYFDGDLASLRVCVETQPDVSPLFLWRSQSTVRSRPRLSGATSALGRSSA